MSLKRFLRIVSPAEIGRHQRRLREELGPDLVTLLLRIGLLRRAGPADHWPCGNTGGGGDGCPRAIVPSGRDDAPLIAVCGTGQACEDILLQEEDRELLVAPLMRLHEVVARLLRITEPRRIEVTRGVFLLGTTDIGGPTREVVYADLGADALLFLIGQRQAAGTPTLLVVPTGARLGSARATVVSGSVLLLVLDEVLRVADGKLRLDLPGVAVVVVPEPAVVAAAPLPFVAYTERGEVQLSAEEYGALVASASSHLDLMIDLATPVQGGRSGRFRAGIRRDGVWHEVMLVPGHAHPLAELAERRGKDLMPRELDCNAHRGSGEAAAVLQRFQIARAQLDAPPWRWFATAPGTRERDLAYGFRPPVGATFAVIRRIRA